jgi:soluble lytic murein transglycosylase-like protein
LRRFCFSTGSQAALAVVAVCGGSLPILASDAAPLTSVVRSDRSGKLVRVVLHDGKTPASRNAVFSSTVERVAVEQALPPELIHSVIKAESNYNPFAISPKGALGIMQLVPATARRFGVADAFNAEENIQGGAKYLKYLLELYHGDHQLAVAAYNAGEGAVTRHGGIPPYPETRNYVNTVLKSEHSSAPHSEQRPPVSAEAPEYNRIEQIVEPDGSVRYVSR